jgi:hypothetical protein
MSDGGSPVKKEKISVFFKRRPSIEISDISKNFKKMGSFKK